jgi:hypothetical protein
MIEIGRSEGIQTSWCVLKMENKGKDCRELRQILKTRRDYTAEGKEAPKSNR